MRMSKKVILVLTVFVLTIVSLAQAEGGKKSKLRDMLVDKTWIANHPNFEILVFQKDGTFENIVLEDQEKMTYELQDSLLITYPTRTKSAQQTIKRLSEDHMTFDLMDSDSLLRFRAAINSEFIIGSWTGIDADSGRMAMEFLADHSGETSIYRGDAPAEKIKYDYYLVKGALIIYTQYGHREELNFKLNDTKDAIMLFNHSGYKVKLTKKP